MGSFSVEKVLTSKTGKKDPLQHLPLGHDLDPKLPPHLCKGQRDRKLGYSNNEKHVCFGGREEKKSIMCCDVKLIPTGSCCVLYKPILCVALR